MREWEELSANLANLYQDLQEQLPRARSEYWREGALIMGIWCLILFSFFGQEIVKAGIILSIAVIIVKPYCLPAVVIVRRLVKNHLFRRQSSATAAAEASVR